MGAYNKHHLHHRHVEHVAEVAHNIPAPRSTPKPSPDSVSKAPELATNNQKATKVEPEVTKPAPILEPTSTEKVKLNPRIAKYGESIEALKPGESINLPPINFISNQDEFAVVNMDSFMEAAEFAKNGFMILIEGHTDDKGSDEYNLALSMKRVEKIKQLMVQMDVPEDNISVVGHGERKPLVPNTSEANRLKNRRIEFVIFKI